MGFRLFALGLKLVLIALVTAIAGFGIWAVGQVVTTSFWFGSDVAITLNAVLSFGLVGGTAAALIGPRISGAGLAGVGGVIAVIALAVFGAWLGSRFLADILVPPTPGRIGPRGIGEVNGALAGALLGALAMPVIIGTQRVMKRLEP